ncbi:unnamed protein product, partial [Durusdinium trenchii]
ADVLCLVELDCFEEQLDGGKEKGGLEGGKRRSRIPGNHYCRGLGLPWPGSEVFGDLDGS